MSLDFGNAEITLYLDLEKKQGEIRAKEPNYSFQIELLKVDEESDETVQERMVVFLQDHLIEAVGDWTIQGKEPNLKDLTSWPLSLVNRLITQYTESFKRLAGVEADEAKKK